jgi:hypothetical protein
MYPTGSHYIAMLALEKEINRMLKRRKLLRAAEQSRSRNRFGRKITHRFGTLMVAWGSKLQNINAVPPADIVVDTKLSR